MKEEDIETLCKLDMNKTEARVYAALCEISDAKPDEISAKSGVQTTRIYEFLEKLKNKGFIRETDNRPKRYSAENPDKIIELKLKSLNKKIRDVSGKIMNIWELSTERPESKEKPFIVSSSCSILTEFKQKLKESKKIRTVIGTFWGYMKIQKFWDSLNKDMDIKIITDQDINPPDDKILIKEIKDINLQYTVFDEKMVFLILEPRPNKFNGIFLSSEGLAKKLLKEFEEIWGEK